jgi:hypothetical protein
VVAEPALGARLGPAGMRRAWALATLLATLCPFVLAVWLAPASGARPVAALTWLLFVGSSVHVAATGWFYTVPEVRAHMSSHRGRYVWVPVALVAGLAATVPLLSTGALTVTLLAFFAWQFFHFQKQNLGVAALAARASGAGVLTQRERRALVMAGVGGITGLVGHPTLLQLTTHRHSDLVFDLGAVVFLAAALLGITGLLNRPAASRPPGFALLYLSGLLFFLPVFVFSSPYAAVAGLTIAHGLQYLLLITLLAAAPRSGGTAGMSLLVLINVALLLGLALNRASHLHDATGISRAIFGAYLGLSTAHFIIDAGLWRLRDEFPRAFLTERLPYLLASPIPPVRTSRVLAGRAGDAIAGD